jgi:RHS repeat-associated protein
MPEAARKTDPIEHSLALAGLLIGAAIGAALVVATAATGGAALALAVAGGVSMGGSVGQIIGSLVPGITTGEVKTGSSNVFTNGLAAARAETDVAACAQHPVPPPPIAQGSDRVFINSFAAVRVKDKTVCDATIASGSGNVFIGGAQATYLDIESEVPAWLEWTIAGLGLVSGVGAIGKLFIQCGLKAGFTALGKTALTVAAGYGAHAASGAMWGEGSWQQKVTDLGMIAAPLGKSMFGRKGALNPFRSEPVYIVTGAVYSERMDFELPWRIPMRWHACYFSDRTRQGTLGRGWESPADIRLEHRPDGTVLFWDGEPFSILFNRLPGTGELVHEGLEGCTLIGVGSSHQVHGKGGLVYRFGAFDGTEALLESIEDSSGNVLRYVRRDGRLETIQESHGTWLELRYDADALREIRLHHPRREEPLTQVRYRQVDGDLVECTDAGGHTSRYGYDEHLLVRYVDRNGLAFSYEYDVTEPSSRCIRESGPEGLYEYCFRYDPDGRWVRYSNSLGHETTIDFDEHRYPIRETDPLGATTSYAYDAWGLTTGVTDPLGRTTEYRYDGYGDVVEIRRPDGRSVAMAYDERHHMVALTDTAGHVWRQEWDELGRMVRQTSPLGAARSYGYGRHGDLVSYTDPRGHTERYEQDPYFAVMRAHHDRLGVQRQWETDDCGRVTAFTDADGSTTGYRYDACGRVVAVETPLQTRVSCEYDPEGNLLAYRDENGHETRFEYTGINEVGRKLLPDGNVVEYRYDTEDQLVALVNERGQVHELRRDAAGRVVEETDYWGHRSERRYDATGQVVEIVDELGRSVSYTRDELGRLVERETSDGEIESFEYDAADNLVRLSNDQGQSARRYDAEGRVLEERQGKVVLTYGYDAAGNCIERRSSLGNEVRSAFDAEDRLAEVWINGTKAARIERDVRGLVTAEELGAGAMRRETSHDALARVTRQRVSTASGWTSDRSFVYDGVGDLQERRDSYAGVDQYLYDPRGQLVRWTDPWGKVQGFVHDPTGSLMEPGGAAGRAGPGRAGEMIVPRPSEAVRSSRLGALEHHHDAAGQVIERHGDRGRQELRWDGLQRLREVTLEDGERWSYAYDAAGRRRAKSSSAGRVTEFFWEGDRLAGETTLDGRAKEYVYWPGSFEPLAVLEAGEARYFHNDPVGVPRELIDGEGKVVWSATYSATGALVEQRERAAVNALRFPGQYFDEETGVCYNRYRYLEPGGHEFLSKDPLGLAAGENPYTYAPNVWGWADPLGLSCKAIGRTGALNQAKRDLGIPRSQHPDANPIKVPMTDRNGVRILGANGKPIMTRQYTYTRPDGSKVLIQDHSAGHTFGAPGGKGDQGSHFNVRPPEDPRNGVVPGTQEHYPFSM